MRTTALRALLCAGLLSAVDAATALADIAHAAPAGEAAPCAPTDSASPHLEGAARAWGPVIAALEEPFAARPGQSRVHPNCRGPQLAPVRESVRLYREIGARPPLPGARLRAYVFAPEGPVPAGGRPAIAMYHGGGWRGGYPVTWFPAARYYASRGFVTVVFQFRLQDTHGGTAADAVDDTRASYRWLSDHAGELGVDSSRILAAGDSSGGHLALTLPLLKDTADRAVPAPRGVLALYPLVDSRIKGEPALSPIAHVDDAVLPPTLVLQGAHDSHPTTPPARTREFCDRANARAGHAVCELTFLDSQWNLYFHGFISERPQLREIYRRFDEFLLREKLLPASETPFDDENGSLRPECEAEVGGEIFEGWLRDYGYAPFTRSRW